MTFPMRNMKKVLAVILTTGLLGSSVGQSATTPLYTNYVSITEAPQVDATAFFNAGLFNLFTSLPFSTQNTLNFTNRGQMFGTPGWRIDYATQGQRRMMNSFVNQGLMESRDFSGFTLFTDADGLITVLPGGTASVSYMLLSATNVFNRGLLSVGNGGLLKIQAQKADLRFSGLRSGSGLAGGGQGSSDSVFNGGTNFFNATGIRDVYWGVGLAQALAENRRQPLDLEAQIDNFNRPSPLSPFHEVQNALVGSNIFNRVRIPGPPRLASYNAFANTGTIDSSNSVAQVVFVAPSLQQGTVTASVRFAPRGGGVAVPVVRISTSARDNVLNIQTTNTVFISDDLLTRSNSWLSLNGQGLTARPVNYRVSTSETVDWITSQPPNSPFNFLTHIYNFDPNSFRFVTNAYTGYAFTVNRVLTPNLGAGFVNLPNRGFNLGNPFAPNFFDPTNLQGRVEIEASRSVDLRGTRLRANQYAIVRSPEILLDENTSLDAPFISLDVGQPQDSLALNGTVPSKIDRISGQIALYSALWTNQVVTFTQGGPPDFATTSNVNFVAHHVLIVDHEQIERTVDVNVTEAFLKGTNIVITDDMRVLRGFRMDSDVFILKGRLDFVQELRDLGPVNFPTTKEIRIEPPFGRILNSGNAHFPGAKGSPLRRFDNGGQWVAGSHLWNVPEFRNFGTLFSVAGPMSITADHANLSMGSLISNFDLTINAKSLGAAFSTISAGSVQNFSGVRLPVLGKLRMSVTDSLLAGGVFRENVWSVTDGFELLVKPAIGDLRGVELISVALPFSEVTHKWAGTDLGPTANGFENNVALRRLTLSGEFMSRFVFDTIDGNNAIYTEYLELLDSAAGVDQALDIRPGMRIYFSDSNVSPLGLDGRFDGRLRWVPAPASAPTTTLTLANGQSLIVPDALLYSVDIDSDGDGVVNAFDDSPFDEIRIQVSFAHQPNPTAFIAWDAAPRTKYEVQYKDAVTDSVWKKLTSFVTYSDKRRVVIEDSAPASMSRYYRVIYTP
jgi:hypothetical protein